MRILVTIDLENMNTPLQRGDYDFNLVTPELVLPLAEALERHGARGVFFASVLEVHRFGEEPLATVWRSLLERGHEVELHLHPLWRLGKDPLWRYDAATQAALVGEGVELLTRLAGRAPLAHRAGAYGADGNTLAALAAHGIPLDASHFPGHPNNRLVDAPVNRLAMMDGVLQLPVTLFRRVTRVGLAHGWGVPVGRPAAVKLDPDWSFPEEWRGFAHWAAGAAGNGTGDGDGSAGNGGPESGPGERPAIADLVLFLHGYSILGTALAAGRAWVDEGKLARLEAFLAAFAAMPGAEFIGVAELLRRYRADPGAFAARGEVPVLERRVTPRRVLARLGQIIRGSAA